MRGLLIVAAAAAAATGCVKIDRYEPGTPESVEAQARASDLRAEMERRCASMGGGVRQKDDTDGSRAGDWTCERERPKRR